jgi:pyruvate/2-oxoglutarate/acetoin dehydrogenase E1 component
VSERELTMSEALNEALHEEMKREPTVFVIGEDVGALGGLFQVTAGLLERFGPQRVIDSPISEAGIAGSGAAPVRVTAKDTPIPYATTLEREVLPQLEDVVAAVGRVLERVAA